MTYGDIRRGYTRCSALTRGIRAISTSVLTRAVEKGCKRPRFLFFLQKNLKTSNSQILRFFRFQENPKKIQIFTHSHSRKLLPFSLISCIQSYAIVCTLL